MKGKERKKEAKKEKAGNKVKTLTDYQKDKQNGSSKNLDIMHKT